MRVNEVWYDILANELFVLDIEEFKFYDWRVQWFLNDLQFEYIGVL